MEPPLCSLFLVGALAVNRTRAGSHSLRYFSTGWSGSELGGGPGFVAVGFVDAREFVRFDGARGKAEPRAAWMQQVDGEDPEYWERNTRVFKSVAQGFGAGLETLRGYYNQSRGGVHTLQFLYGCEVSPDGRFLRGFSQSAYDGRDYLALDTQTWTWAATQPQAEITKRKWEAGSVAERRKAYLEEECVLWLQKYLQMGRGALTRADPPSARVTRHTGPLGEVTLRCRAQDFYPSPISLTWLKEGEEQLQDMEFIETRPGGEGTFQTWVTTGVPPGQEGSYTCRVQHQGLAEPLTLKWEPPPSSTWTILGVILGVLLLLTAVIVGLVTWKKSSGEGPGHEQEEEEEKLPPGICLGGSSPPPIPWFWSLSLTVQFPSFVPRQ
ncbi:BOLA class I histocompatibility antigen, alpha chain BL3-7-like [Macrotis lagotis]|uniref:BOLA class I histocompatibility antigen, alpha chain BL3-7-like n=1 Tax=Macrotis lagotis TaxID=92651 RepID=UPI003D6947C8